MSRRSENDIYTEYYLNQAGSGFSNIYAAPSYQRGYGIGSFLGGLFRSVYPILKKGSIALGTELLKTGASCLGDISRSEDPQETFKKRGKEVVNNLSRRAADHMFGSGYKNAIPARKRLQSTNRTTSVKKKRLAPEKNKKKQTRKVKAKTQKPKAQKPKTKKRSKRDLFDIFS